MGANALTTEMILVMFMIGVAVFLFIVEWIRVDMVAILMTITLPLLHLVTPKEAFSGFSSNAVISIIAVIIIGAGLDKTGVINRVVKPVMKIAGNSSSRIIIAMGATVAGISSFMQNIGAAALFLPAIKRVSKSMNISLSQMLMPIGFCAILGGTITLVGCSPLILLNDLLAPFNLKPFRLFDVSPIGLALVGSGIAFFILFGRFVLPKGKVGDAGSSGESMGLESSYEHLGDAFELKVPGDFTDFRDPLTIKDIREKYLVNVVAIAGRDGFKVLSAAPDTEIRSDSDIAVYGLKQNAEKMAKELGMQIKSSLDVFQNEMSEAVSGTIEAVVAPRSDLIGKTLRKAHFWEQFQVNPLAIYRSDKAFYSGLSDFVLRSGDSILLQGTWERFNILQERHNFIFTTPVSEVLKPEKALISGFWLAVALVMIIIFKIQLSVCLMTGAFGMIVCRVLTIDEAYKSVDWRTIFLLAGLIPLGIATEKTGTAAWIAYTILNLIGDVSPVVLLTAIAVLSTFFTLVISNVGATVLLVPLVVNMAMAAGTDPRMAALVVGLATSNSFMLPTHQVNALYMGPGRYRSVDFIKAGGIMTVLFIVVLIGMLYLFYGV
ncbi:MAG: SLC13 family permease [Desulfobacteraceae bacterium]|nr:SLC13 family permease [Pseudomonadota bacterium]MBU4463790.1 SLC13 family permease [Pseudomonadota bacterium]MCG2755738.1 SLC13 family permease [Desulfobacteraceae bacterium]